MKRIIILFAAIATLAACSKKTPSTGKFGDQAITEEGAVPIQDFMATLDGATEKTGKVTGKIIKVCQGEGCWFNLDAGEGNYVHIVTKDESFSVPKDASGKTAIAQGTLKKKDDAKMGYEFEATGVIIK